MPCCGCLCWWDSQMDAVEVNCPPEMLSELKDTVLKPSEIQYLYQRFCYLGLDYRPFPPQHLKKFQFIKLVRFADNPLASSILSVMFGNKKLLTFPDFARFIAIFHENNLNTKKEKIEEAKYKKLKLLFNMYDNDQNGVISEEDFIAVVHKLYSRIMRGDQIVRLANTAISEMDTTYTHQIMFEDFCNALTAFDMEESLVLKIPAV